MLKYDDNTAIPRNPFGAETRMFEANLINAMAADDLAPSITGLPATMVLTMHDKLDFVLYKPAFLGKWQLHMGQVTKVQLSCYLVLLSNDSKTR